MTYTIILVILLAVIYQTNMNFSTDCCQIYLLLLVAIAMAE